MKAFKLSGGIYDLSYFFKNLGFIIAVLGLFSDNYLGCLLDWLNYSWYVDYFFYELKSSSSLFTLDFLMILGAIGFSYIDLTEIAQRWLFLAMVPLEMGL